MLRNRLISSQLEIIISEILARTISWRYRYSSLRFTGTLMALSCLPLCVGTDCDQPMDLILKKYEVKYGGMLRRFNIFMTDDGDPVFSLDTLRYKICNLFKFNRVSDIIITYIDQDNDVITMVDDYDFLDAVRQGLNPLHLEVFLTGEKDVGAIMGSSTLRKIAIPKGNDGTLNPGSICLDETLKDLPEIANGTTHNEQENENDFEFQAGSSGLSPSIETHCNDIFHHGPENLSGPLASPVSRNVAANRLKDAYNFFYNWFSKLGNEDGYRRFGYARVADYLKMDNVGDSNRLWRNLSKASIMPPSYSRSQGSSISSLLSSVGKMFNRSPGTLDCYFVKNVTVFEGAQLSPRTRFTKIWRLRNTGTLPWPPNTQLVRVGGDDLGSENEAKLKIQKYGYPVGEEFDVAVNGITPIQPGQYASYWCLMAPSGEMFGQRLKLLMEVVESSKQGFLPHPTKYIPTEFKDPNADAGSSQVQSNVKLFGTAIFGKVSDEKRYTSDDKMNFNPPDVVVTIPDGGSMIKEPGEKPSGLTVQGSDVPIQLQGVNMDTTFTFSSVGENSLLSVPVIDVSEGNFDESVNAPSWVMSDISVKNPIDVKQMQSFQEEFEGMGINQRKLNADVLRNNDLQNTLDALRVPAEWNPILEVLQEMGFSDMETNKRVLLENNGSVKRAVLHLVLAEKNATN